MGTKTTDGKPTTEAGRRLYEVGRMAPVILETILAIEAEARTAERAEIRAELKAEPNTWEDAPGVGLALAILDARDHS